MLSLFCILLMAVVYRRRERQRYPDKFDFPLTSRPLSMRSGALQPFSRGSHAPTRSRRASEVLYSDVCEIGGRFPQKPNVEVDIDGYSLSVMECTFAEAVEVVAGENYGETTARTVVGTRGRKGRQSLPVNSSTFHLVGPPSATGV